MDSSIINISEILNNAKSFTSAGFSAGYSFDAVNACEYFDELLANSSSQTPIFSGILILEKSGENFTIIDGLQRITTISLLLCALCESYKNISANNQNTKDKIFKMFLIDKGQPKLELTGEEQKIYQKILFSCELNDNDKKSNLFQAYQSFLDKIKSHKISGTDLFKIISKIQFMVIITEKSEVSSRDLYQTINSSKNKSQINLISDFICQKNNSAGKVWLDVVNFYGDLGYMDLLHSFIKDFLIIQNDGKIPQENALYNNFKSYFSQISKYRNIEKIVDNLCKYAKYYLKIINADFEDSEIHEQLITLNENNGQDAYPYLMEVLDDLENSHINQEVFLDILLMVNSFIKNRQEDPLSDFTIDFATLSKELNKMLVLKNYTPKIVDENKLTINEINNLTTFEV